MSLAEQLEAISMSENDVLKLHEGQNVVTSNAAVWKWFWAKSDHDFLSQVQMYTFTKKSKKKMYISGDNTYKNHRYFGMM